MLDIKEVRTQTEKFSILCVEDDKNILTELQELLKIFFKKVYCANSGEEAFEIYSKHQKQINIVLTDINMPKMDGLTLSQKIKDNDILEYIIVLSARQDIELYSNCLDIGINDLMIKPITSEKILKVLGKYLTYIQQLEVRKLNCSKNENRCELTAKNKELFTDKVTGLFTKSKLDEYLLSNEEFHVVLVNLDNFDHVNSKYGYKIGDQVLKNVGEYFLNITQEIENCTAYRVVSDEFVFLLPHCELEVVDKLCHMILKELSTNKIKTQVDEFFISCTIGISSGSGQDILRQAHIAMKESREIGKEKYYFFTNNLQVIQKREKNLQWFNKIKDILKKDAVIPYYQPVIDNNDKRIYMYESLARIMEINRIIQPYYFIESAKLFNLMPNITILMIKKVFQFVEGHSGVMVSINLTKEDLQSEEFIKNVSFLIEQYSIDCSKIVFEFSELITISDDEMIFTNLNKLAEKGFKLSIDDFGSNHYNIKKLHSLKISYLKINNILIETLLEDKKAKKVVEFIIKLAHDIGAKTIAQSVSSKEIQDEVKSVGIDFSQGYFIGKPNEVI